MALRLLWEPRDLWVGVYWTVENERANPQASHNFAIYMISGIAGVCAQPCPACEMVRTLLVYVCLLPTVVVKWSKELSREYPA